MAKNGNRLPEVVRTVKSRLFVVTVNGADRPGGGGRFILPLGEGDFDVAGWLQTLRDAGYRGPVGLQCLGVPGDPKENLGRSMAAWKKYQGN
jgi:sugar phosphate isomerase/epimerase